MKITLTQPYAPLASLLAFNNSAAIIIRGKQDDVDEGLIGTGPYMLKERKADQYIQLTRFRGLQIPGRRERWLRRRSTPVSRRNPLCPRS